MKPVTVTSIASLDLSPGSTSIRVLDPCLESNWDAMVMSLPNHKFFHSQAWAKVLKETYGFQPCYLVAYEGMVPLALQPLMEIRSLITGHRGVALPFTDECGPLVAEPAALADLLNTAMVLGGSKGWRYLELRGGTKVLGGLRESVAFHGHRLQLGESEKQLFARLDAAARRAIRKAEREGVVVRISSTLEALKSFFDLHCRTRKKHGLPPQPFSFFRSICRNILEKGHGFVAVATCGARKVAAAVYFVQGRMAVYKFGASDERFQASRGNNLVMWEAIKHLIRAGFSELDFGRTSIGNEGLRRFKLSWGSEEHRVSYAKYDFGKRQFVGDVDRAFGHHNCLFRMMPITLARLVGAVIYRHMA